MGIHWVPVKQRILNYLVFFPLLLVLTACGSGGISSGADDESDSMSSTRNVPSFSISDVNITEGDAGTVKLVFTAGVDDQAVSVTPVFATCDISETISAPIQGHTNVDML